MYEDIVRFRKQLKTDFGLPIKLELHAKHFLLNKEPYRQFNFNDDDRMFIIELFCELISMLAIKIINVVINKKVIYSGNYSVLDRALTYSIQRIENDLLQTEPDSRFMIITDTGRVGKMRKTARKIQKINFIPSKFNPYPYRKEIKLLIEDPLPKDSKESYFIQICDLVGCIIYFYSILTLASGSLPNRMPSRVDKKILTKWLDILQPSLNLKAAESDPYGIVCYPK